MKGEYSKLALRRGVIIKEIIRIERQEKTHFLIEDADFFIAIIRKFNKTRLTRC
ncbi:MAG: hypothetical protein ACRD8Z_20155 [Nitrososphaeraceae archaeon]